MDFDSHSGHLIDGAASIRPTRKPTDSKPQTGAGQGGGDSHIRFSVSKAEERRPLSGRVGGPKDPTPAFDEFGNPVYREEGEDKTSMPLI